MKKHDKCQCFNLRSKNIKIIHISDQTLKNVPLPDKIEKKDQYDDDNNEGADAQKRSQKGNQPDEKISSSALGCADKIIKYSDFEELEKELSANLRQFSQI